MLMFHVRNAEGERIAAFLHAEDAARFVGGQDMYLVSYGGRASNIVWSEGAEAFSAAESFDKAAEIMLERAPSGLTTS